MVFIHSSSTPGAYRLSAPACRSEFQILLATSVFEPESYPDRVIEPEYISLLKACEYLLKTLKVEY